MQVQRRTAAGRQVPARLGSGKMQRRVMAVGGHPPQVSGGGHPPQGSGGAHPPQGSGGAHPPQGSGGAHPPQGSGGAHPPQWPGGVQPPQWPGGAQPPQWPGSGQHPPWPGSCQMTQWNGGSTNLQMAGVEDLNLPTGPPMADVPGFGVESSAAFEHAANDDSTVNGNGYYSNMMMDDINVDDLENFEDANVEQPSEDEQVRTAAPSSRPNHKRQKNFSNHEDEILVSAWLNISLDPIVGKEQKSSRYWFRISDYFHQHKKCQSQRTISSLKHRWETIQRCVNIFCGCLTRIELRKKSGTTISDKVAEACALYKSEDKDDRAFQFMHCWNKLKTQPKWLAKLDELAGAGPSNKRPKTNCTIDLSAGPSVDPSADPLADPSAHDEGGGLQAIALARPIGKKKAKAALIQEKKKSVTATLENMWTEKKEADAEKQLKKEQKKDERFNKAFALEQERVANDKLAVALEQERVANEKLLLQVRSEEVQLQKKRDEERIMTMDLTALPEDQKTYYMFLRSQIMSQLSMPST